LPTRSAAIGSVSRFCGSYCIRRSRPSSSLSTLPLAGTPRLYSRTLPPPKIRVLPLVSSISVVESTTLPALRTLWMSAVSAPASGLCSVNWTS
jgi:hypothetical protein